MVGTQRPVTAPDDVQLLAWDLAAVAGVLSEIATTWRRAGACRPGLPLALPQRLADTARQLAADTRSLAGAGQEKPGLAASLAEHISALRLDLAAARAMTCGPDASGVGDAGLWALIGPGPRGEGNQLAGWRCLPAASSF